MLSLTKGSARLAQLIEKGATQVDVAKACGVSQSAVSRWLKGTPPKTYATRNKIRAFAREYCVTIPIDSWDEPMSAAA